MRSVTNVVNIHYQNWITSFKIINGLLDFRLGVAGFSQKIGTNLIDYLCTQYNSIFINQLDRFSTLRRCAIHECIKPNIGVNEILIAHRLLHGIMVQMVLLDGAQGVFSPRIVAMVPRHIFAKETDRSRTIRFGRSRVICLNLIFA
jgi:hypothetical protein